MILFWNNTYYMGLAVDNNSIAQFQPVPTYYYVINYLVALVFISAFFIGTTLNPFVMKFNWSKRKVIISLLFILNASVDMVVCVLIPLFYAYLMVQPKIVFYNYHYEHVIVAIMCTFGCTSQVCTTLLGVSRLIITVSPFFKINSKKILWYLGTHLLYMFILILFVILILTGHIEQNILHELILACFSVTFLHCIIGSASSAITVVMLYKISFRQEDKQLVREKRKSAITILLMNLPHFVTSACILTSIVSPGGISWFDINFIFCPILTATLNPLLIVTRSAAVKQFIRDKLHLQLEKLTKVYRGPIIKMNIKGPRKQLKATKSISVPATGATFKNASYMTSV